MKVIGVKFKRGGKMYHFDPGEIEINKGDDVIVETVHGIEYGTAVCCARDIPEEQLVAPVKKVLRIATRNDYDHLMSNEDKADEAYSICIEKIKKHNLKMKLVDVEYAFDNSKIIFFFTADGRVDFRELVKDLASAFKTRIELRQIAVRDETKIIGGLGPCGNEICCKRFLSDFASVSIKMAKEQNLSFNPAKISGLCGRLICCLNYEKDFYSEMAELMPEINETVLTPHGNGVVTATFPIKESVRVKITSKDESSSELYDVPLSQIKRTHRPKKAKQEQADAIDPELEKLTKE